MHNPGNYTIRIEPGNTYSRSLAVTQADGTPYDLTGFTATLSVTDQGVAISGVTPACSITDPDGGLVAFAFDLTDVAILDDIEDGRFTLIVANGDNSIVMTLLKGRITSNRWANG